MKDYVVLSRNDQKLYSWAMNVIYEKLSLKEFSLLSGFSYRHAQRVIKSIEKKGVLALVLPQNERFCFGEIK